MLKLLARGVSFMRQSLLNEQVFTDDLSKFEEERTKDENGEVEEKIFYGRVTSIHDGYGLVDESIYFDFDAVVGGFRPRVGLSVRVQGVRHGEDGEWRAKSLDVWNEDWDEDGGEKEVVDLQIGDEGVERTCMVGMVSEVDETWGLINAEVKFDLHVVEDGFVVQCGDWVEVTMLFSEMENRRQVVKVSPLRKKQIAGRISYVYPDYGVIENEVYFLCKTLNEGVYLKRGDQVYAATIESSFKKFSWRATCVIPISITNGFARNSKPTTTNINNSPAHELFKDKNNITITTPLNFGSVQFVDDENEEKITKSLKIQITNQGQQNRTLISYQLLSSANGQFTCRPLHLDTIDKPVILKPGETIDFVAECQPRILGNSSQLVVFNFNGFSIGRFLSVNVYDEQQKLISVAEPFRGPVNKCKGLPYSMKLNNASWVVPGQRVYTNLRNYGSLLQYKVPKELWDCVMNKRDLMLLEPCLIKPLNKADYKTKLRTLLHIEEIQMEYEMEQYTLNDVYLERKNIFLVLEVPGLPEGRPSLIIGDIIVVTYSNSNADNHYEGFIHEVSDTLINLKFHPTFHEKYNDDPVNVNFKFNRTSLRRCHQAVDLSDILGPNLLFPKDDLMPTESQTPFKCNCDNKPMSPQTSNTKKKRVTVVQRLFGNENSTQTQEETEGTVCDCEVIKYLNPKLNERQKLAVHRILSGAMKSTPYVIFGPPGTGKTVTVVEAILQVLHLCNNSRVLVCAPSNSAADLLTERLHMSGGILPGWMVRVNAFQRTQNNIPECIHEYCHRCDNLPLLVRHKVVICTCSTSGVFHGLNLPPGHFTHVFIDEAGQATEPECLIPLLFVGQSGQAILAGDPEQLGPVIHSRFAISCGLSTSFLERLMQLPLYARNADKFPRECYNPLVVTKLINNYRSHPALLRLPSKLFYNDELIAKGDPTVYSRFCATPVLPAENFPVIFHGIQGENLREGNNPSWFNAVEVMQVLKYLRELYALGVVPGDIGILTPYRKQVEKIRFMLERLGMDVPKIGSTEEFQGQERLVMIISTVRSCDDEMEAITNLGFVGNKKRFNVSITRAQALLIIVGNPFILSKDANWKELLIYCVENGGYVGCDLPNCKRE